MIVFELKCGEDHHFEAWFRDGKTFDAQAAAGEITCPQCGDRAIGKAPMAPRIAKSRGDAATTLATEMRQALTDLRQQVESNCDYVGDSFPEEARKIHYGETQSRPIYGEATADDAKALQDEGVEVQRIPWLPRQN